MAGSRKVKFYRVRSSDGKFSVIVKALSRSSAVVFAARSVLTCEQASGDDLVQAGAAGEPILDATQDADQGALDV